MKNYFLTKKVDLLHKLEDFCFLSFVQMLLLFFITYFGLPKKFVPSNAFALHKLLEREVLQLVLPYFWPNFKLVSIKMVRISKLKTVFHIKNSQNFIAPQINKK